MFIGPIVSEAGVQLQIFCFLSLKVFGRRKTDATRRCTSCGHIAVMIGRNTSIGVSTDNSWKNITVHVDNFQSSEFNARYVYTMIPFCLFVVH